MVNRRKRIIKSVFIFIFLILCGKASFAVNLDFYATVTNISDIDMVNMATDLYFSQFQALPGFYVNDKRRSTYSQETALKSNISFYAELLETDDGKWTSTLNAIDPAKDKIFSFTKTYETYYLILIDAKDSIQNLIDNLNSSKGDSIESSKPEASAEVSLGMETIAGNWNGGKYIDKIVILRGGRGFVIYKNGASMDISISINGKFIKIKQAGKSNASFFPELAREVALQSAPSASPVEWTFTLSDNNTLTGTKTTLIPDESSSTGASTGTISEKWTRK